MGKKEKEPAPPATKNASAPVAKQPPATELPHVDAAPDANTASVADDSAKVCPVNLASAFGRFTDHWKPKVVADLNGQQIRLVKFQGEFIWHRHEHEDELFLVHRGSFVMEFRDRKVELREGEMIVIPRGVEHRPVAEQEVEVILFEPATTVNIGDSKDTSRKARVTRLDSEPKSRKPAHKAKAGTAAKLEAKPQAKSASLRRHRVAKKSG